MDYWTLSAKAIDKDGNEGVFSVKFSEKSSACTPLDEKLVYLMYAADQAKVQIVGTMIVESDDRPVTH